MRRAIRDDGKCFVKRAIALAAGGDRKRPMLQPRDASVAAAMNKHPLARM